MIYSPLQAITLDGLKIKYRSAGHGPNLIMIHGWASSSRMWQRLMNDLANRYHCMALDLPGFGDSDKPDDDWYSLERYKAIVQKFAEALDLQFATLIGHSMGGLIALAMATDSVTNVSRVAVINPVVTGRTYWDLRLLSNSPLGKPMLSLGRWFWPIASGDWAGPWLGKERAEHYRRMREEWLQSSPAALRAALRVIGQSDLSPNLSKVTVPTLVLLGSRDLTAPNAEGKLAARTIPSAQLRVLPSGHLPTDDMPVETLQALEEFLMLESVLIEG